MKPAFVALVLLTLAIGASPSAAEAQLAIPINGGNFVGTFTVADFANRDGQVLARGILSGILQTGTGPVSVVKPVALPATIGQASCQILHLEIGPQDLDLLGLMVHLDGGVLNATPGNSLGNPPSC
jgi:hypothetical protein